VAFTFWNHLSSIGYAITFVGLIVFLVMLAEAAVRRRPARANPWGAGATTLEWTLPSPPPYHQFHELPVFDAEHH
jgi:cytochrome c oxidase subunit 1